MFLGIVNRFTNRIAANLNFMRVATGITCIFPTETLFDFQIKTPHALGAFYRPIQVFINKSEAFGSRKASQILIEIILYSRENRCDYYAGTLLGFSRSQKRC